ncbi:transmembrane protein 45A-like [Dipodomys merriami]|uniref:transmembrane protein 45A-like n=1 Tax=Dipodomys merriami TaxID=94247 RepID=UPI003856005C
MNNSEHTIGVNSPKVKGSFAGHALPGAIVFTLGFWWYIKILLMYIYKKQTRTCYIRYKAFFQRAEILEGIISLCIILTGVIVLQIKAVKEDQWLRFLRFHHLTIYLFIGLWAVTNILCFSTRSIPVSLTKLMLANAFLVTAFIFYNHNHGQKMVDSLLHQLQSVATFLAGLVSFIELLIRKNIMLKILWTSFVLLQGSWLCQVGFVLYTPTGGPAWDLNDHSNSTFLLMCFCWHYAFAYVVMGVVYVAVTWLAK